MVTRIKVVPTLEFSPAEWLRREVLWASLMTPYNTQFEGWVKETAYAQHSGNVTRRHVYEAEDDPEFKALAFFNHGKTIGGLISSAVMFKVYVDEPHYVPETLIVDQSLVVADVLKNEPNYFSDEDLSEKETFDACTSIASSIFQNEYNPLNPSEQLQASKMMSALACREAKIWVASSVQDDAEGLPVLTIPNGGHPRSAGERVDRLQPIFRKIVDSDRYRALAS